MFYSANHKISNEDLEYVLERSRRYFKYYFGLLPEEALDISIRPATNKEEYEVKKAFHKWVDDLPKMRFFDILGCREYNDNLGFYFLLGNIDSLIDVKNSLQCLSTIDPTIPYNMRNKNLFCYAYYRAARYFNDAGKESYAIPTAKLVFQEYSDLLWQAKLFGVDVNGYERYMLPTYRRHKKHRRSCRVKVKKEVQ